MNQYSRNNFYGENYAYSIMDIVAGKMLYNLLSLDT
jgi:hypothetical protein